MKQEQKMHTKGCSHPSPFFPTMMMNTAAARQMFGLRHDMNASW